MLRSRGLILLLLLTVFLCSFGSVEAAPQESGDAITPAVFSGSNRTMAINDAGEVYVWGGPYQFPTKLEGVSNVVDIALNDRATESSHLLRSDGAVWALTPSGELSVVEGLSDVVAIEGGWRVLTALKQDGTVWTRGYNGMGALGLGHVQSIWDSFSQVPNLASVVAIASNGRTTLALRADGTVWGWGNNIYNRLNLDSYESCGSFECSRSARQVQGLSDIVAIADGFNSFMALDSSGSLWVWGLATSGQLGDGSDPGNVSPPQPVPAFAGVEQIDMGPSFCLARKGDGTVWSWGDRIDGVAFSSEVLWPTLVEGLANVESVSSDSLRESAYAIKADGSVWAWGANSDNLLGDGSDLSRDAPVPVIGEAGIGFLSLKSTSIQPTLDSLAITGAALIPSGANSRYAATARYRDGRTLSVAAQWDLMDEKATVDADGLVSTLFSSSMRIVELSATYSDGDKSVVAEKQITIAGNAPDEVAPQIEARNNFHNLVLLPDGRVKSWGKNGDGQLGDGTKKTRSTAVQVNELTGVASLAANQSNSFALKSDGSVWSWGGNFYDSLGSGDSVTVDGATPGQIEGLGDIVHIASKFLNTGGYAVTANGALWEWGQERGQPSPNQLYDAPDNIVSIRDPLVVTADGKVWTLDSIRAGNPIAIEPLDNIVATATIWGFMEPVSYFALDGAGAIWAWGSNVRGQLGDGGQTPRAEPAKILGLPEVTAIAAGYESVYAVDSAGKLWSWGRNDTNIFPGGLTANVLSPTQIPGVSGVIKVAAGFKHILLLHQDGTVRTLGRNQDAQLGIGTISDSEDLSLVVDSSLTTFLDLYPVAQNDITPDLMPPFLSATITDGALENLTLDIELNLNDVLAELQPRSTGGAVYNVYVAALIPAATLNAAQDAIFTLNSSNLWSHYLGGALPAFMHNVEVASADHRLVLQILSSLDVSQLVGTTIFVGYGTSDSEMLANGRYRAVYTVLEPE